MCRKRSQRSAYGKESLSVPTKKCSGVPAPEAVDKRKVFVVTGSSRGLGEAIATSLADQCPNSIIYVTSRNLFAAQRAKDRITSNLGTGCKAEMTVHKLDIQDAYSCNEFVRFLRKRHLGIDVLVNNASFEYASKTIQDAATRARITIGVNYRGTKLVTGALAPLFRPNGRIVIVTDKRGLASEFNYGPQHLQILQNPYISAEDIDGFVNEYIRSASRNTRYADGFPEDAYIVSKTAQIAWATVVAKRMREEFGVSVNTCCLNLPAKTKNEEISFKKTAETPVYLATVPEIPDALFVDERIRTFNC
ncbi:hypothetical protein L596_018925 [Steinernema carpocapsae]|uniref:Uncharacterized protein n=1 Tax=Steinernema carpocapsae TaxID=34508 RepID=A0A4U5N635_STECR|nr:hypothetical protein L596_018925 [Steinernema carpocapsae]